MKPQFKIINGIRFVAAVVSKLHVHHPECVPNNTEVKYDWVRTQKTCCATCKEPIYKEVKKVNRVVKGLIEVCDECEEKVDVLWMDHEHWMLCPRCWELHFPKDIK